MKYTMKSPFLIYFGEGDIKNSVIKIMYDTRIRMIKKQLS